MKRRTILAVAASALLAFAAWPFLLSASHASVTAQPPSPATPAPVMADYRYRNAIVSDLERDVEHHPDQLVTSMLAQQYLQRYREHADVGDLLRAVSVIQQSLALQPRYNIGAESTLASALVALHRFQAARQIAGDVARVAPWSSPARSTLASIDMELGRYGEASRLLRRLPQRADPGWETVAARYDELSGNISRARALIADAMLQTDSVYARPAENRAWYHWRAGELAFEAGDLSTAQAEYERSLRIYPAYWHGFNGLAKLYWARRQWAQALDFANRAAELYPQPETLGYKYDAQRALGDDEGAAQTRDLIEAIERIGDAQGLSDRLIALFYADHDTNTGQAVTTARRDLARRDDIYAEDALAWALAAAGDWRQARAHAKRAVRLGTQDARLQYHAGIIALHCGERDEARAKLELALRLNPQFHPTQAEAARQTLRDL